MKPISRPYQTEDDFWRMREFLRQVFLLNDRHEWSWFIARLDYARWHMCMNCANVTLDEIASLWEADGQLVAFLMPDGGRGEAHLCIHPAYKTAALEEEMLDTAEARLYEPRPDGARRLCVWCPDVDLPRQEMLARRGYQKGNWHEHQWRRNLDGPIPDAPLAAGYTVRSLGDGLELLERCYASGLGFHDGDLKIATDNRNDITWYRNIQTAPLYRRDLDLVAVAPDGAIASFCTIWFDDVTRAAYFEPVASVPAYQRRGLGKAVMIEGLRRLQRMGATLALVGGHWEGANSLYRSVMGPDHEIYEVWVKEWK